MRRMIRVSAKSLFKCCSGKNARKAIPCIVSWSISRSRGSGKPHGKRRGASSFTCVAPCWYCRLLSGRNPPHRNCWWRRPSRRWCTSNTRPPCHSIASTWRNLPMASFAISPSPNWPRFISPIIRSPRPSPTWKRFAGNILTVRIVERDVSSSVRAISRCSDSRMRARCVRRAVSETRSPCMPGRHCRRSVWPNYPPTRRKLRCNAWMPPSNRGCCLPWPPRQLRCCV